MTKNILLVDNDKFFREFLSGVLIEEGYEVDTAKDGIEVLEKIDTVKPDIIILDLVMENFDGDQVINFLKRNKAYENLPIILLSGLSQKQISESSSLRADVFIPKGDKDIMQKTLLKNVKKILKEGKSKKITDESKEPDIKQDGEKTNKEKDKKDSKMKNFHEVVILELLKKSKNFQTILNNLSEGIVVSDENFRIKYINEGLQKILGLKPEMILGKELQEFLTVIDTNPKTVETFSSQSKQKSRHKIFEVFYKDKILKCKTSFLQKGKNIGGIFLVITDMTEQKALQDTLELEFKKRTDELEKTYKELQKTNLELIKASEIKSQFVANVSHELRSPLNDIMGFVQLIQGKIYGPTTEKQNEALMHIMQNSKSLLKMINEILDVTKLDKDEMPVIINRIHPRELIEQVIGSYSWIGEAKELDIQVFYSDNLPYMETDDAKLKRILLNLVDNAVKFTEQGHIHLKVLNHSEEEKIEILVEDTGIGITDEAKELIFQPFRQIDESSTRQYGGVGLGLYIVKKLVEMLKGTIDIASKSGKGTTFKMKFPHSMQGGVND